MLSVFQDCTSRVVAPSYQDNKHWKEIRSREEDSLSFGKLVFEVYMGMAGMRGSGGGKWKQLYLKNNKNM